MKGLKGACMFCQSGGPTAVINSSAAGVFIEALKQENITEVYGAEHGVLGILQEKFYDISKEDMNELKLLRHTPSSALGSSRYKLKDYTEDDTDYRRLLEVFRKYDIRFFFYNGGNDSMDTCNKISKYMEDRGYDVNVIGVPKTIDNDLYGTDHCPGFASAAKYIATTVMECNLDAKVYNFGLVCIIEVMGRNAGWLAASAALAGRSGLGADLIYLPEVPFDVDRFVNDVFNVCERNEGKCIAVVAEGLKRADGTYVGDFKAGQHDHFGHAAMGGLAALLGSIVKERLGVKVRPIELSLLQRCATHLASAIDVDEAYQAGVHAVRAAVAGETDKMVVFERDYSADTYVCNPALVSLEHAANAERKVPAEWIIDGGKYISDEFVEYALPLIQGDVKVPHENGLPRFAKLKKIYAKK
ncbi:MAG TPA: 6-phosphofructokinase [Candidatus Limadaptatus stercorigallinarum]|uniref:Pyrophosphate--fructose 6-phosphate 1-phosphotransferase n=1 Tax=Candidatus Limadaptatus stercorigallinarum TaxID=2840845 RepID=A0A9D1L1N1_9FIRM|nr:6-phosphofructokinase [Christensenellales bacterium]HIU20795.1 6-phosphofructokinase [Candidatus Limadaptatus stercorigallinarum]